jgi:hypothetical protein
MARMRRGLLTIALLGSICFISGCPLLLAGGAGAGGMAYYKGELKAELNGTPSQVIQATERAFEDLIWIRVAANASATDGQAEAKTATGKEVHVTVKQKTANVSEIGIRVGVMGDETLSRTLLDKIKAKL